MVDNDQLELFITGCFRIRLDAYNALVLVQGVSCLQAVWALLVSWLHKRETSCTENAYPKTVSVIKMQHTYRAQGCRKRIYKFQSFLPYY